MLMSVAALAQPPQQAAPQPAPAQPLVQVRGNEGAGSTIFGNACGGCHGKLEAAPPPAMLKKLTPEKIYEALTTGDMRNQAANLTDVQKRDIAEWVSGRSLGATEQGGVKAMSNPCGSQSSHQGSDFGSGLERLESRCLQHPLPIHESSRPAAGVVSADCN